LVTAFCRQVFGGLLRRNGPVADQLSVIRQGNLAGSITEWAKIFAAIGSHIKKKGPKNVSDAEWFIPAAAGKDQEVAADDYPHKAPFNAVRKGEFRQSFDRLTSINRNPHDRSKSR
jgi:hypothetical protein